jgi:hypothetical protein
VKEQLMHLHLPTRKEVKKKKKKKKYTHAFLIAQRLDKIKTLKVVCTQ